MILRELVNYYDRSDELARAGWERNRIPFLIEIREDGTFVQLTSLRSGPKRQDVPAQLVPVGETSRSGTKAYEKPNLLWDHIGFVLGHAKSDKVEDIVKAEKQFEHFRMRINNLARSLPNSPSLKAVTCFYERGEHFRVRSDPLWKDCCAVAGCNVTFRLVGHVDLLVQEEDIRAIVEKLHAADDCAKGRCLVTGETGDITRLHRKITGVGREPAPLVSINDPAYESFGKKQGENFPVGSVVSFKYATALNHLLQPKSLQKFRVGDDVAVFWSRQKDPIEDDFAAIFGNSNPDAHVIQVRRLYESIHRGDFDGARGKNVFFVLGLAALSRGRLGVRFWYAMPLSDLAGQIKQWFKDLEIVGAGDRLSHPSLNMLLSQVCPATREQRYGDISKLPPTLIAQTLMAAFRGSELPALLLQAALNRIRSDQARKDDSGKPVRHVSTLRAAMLKTFINRQRRGRSNERKDISVALDKSNAEPPYLWGRMFAAYERMQEKAAGRELNRTIRDAYFGSAMATPRTVYIRLARLNQVHLRDLKRASPSTGRYFDRLLMEIAEKLPSDPAVAFPAQATSLQQACFAIGYYHQRQDLQFKHGEVPTVGKDTVTTAASI